MPIKSKSKVSLTEINDYPIVEDYKYLGAFWNKTMNPEKHIL
jgi:hypothetical protein